MLKHHLLCGFPQWSSHVSLDLVINPMASHPPAPLLAAAPAEPRLEIDSSASCPGRDMWRIGAVGHGRCKPYAWPSGKVRMALSSQPKPASSGNRFDASTTGLQQHLIKLYTYQRMMRDTLEDLQHGPRQQESTGMANVLSRARTHAHRVNSVEQRARLQCPGASTLPSFLNSTSARLELSTRTILPGNSAPFPQSGLTPSALCSSPRFSLTCGLAYFSTRTPTKKAMGRGAIPQQAQDKPSRSPG